MGTNLRPGPIVPSLLCLLLSALATNETKIEPDRRLWGRTRMGEVWTQLLDPGLPRALIRGENGEVKRACPS